MADNSSWVKKPRQKKPTEDFITDYMDYATGLTDAYVEYHEAAALFLLSAAVRRNVFVRLKHDTYYPAVWFLLLGNSGEGRKSTAIKIAEAILRRIEEIHVYPDDSTPEYMIEEMSDVSQGVWVRDEIAGWFALLNKNYMDGMKELYMKLYDCVEYYKRGLRQQVFELDKVFISLITATTPSRLQKNVIEEDFYSGWLARFTMVFPTGDRVYQSVRRFSEQDEVYRKKLTRTLNYLVDLFKSPTEATITDVCLQMYNEFLKENDNLLGQHINIDALAAFYNRLGETALKMALLHEIATCPTLMECKNKTHYGEQISYEFEIRVESMQKGIDFARRIRKRLDTIVIFASSPEVEKVYEHLVNEFARTDNKPVAHSRLLRLSHLNSKPFKDALGTLAEQERIKTIRNGRSKGYEPLEVMK